MNSVTKADSILQPSKLSVLNTNKMGEPQTKRGRDEITDNNDTLCPDDFEVLDDTQQRKLIYSKLVEIEYGNKKIYKEIAKDVSDL